MKRNYFIIKPAVNTIETGQVYPQIQKMSDGYNYDANNSVYALSRNVSQFPDFIPNLNDFVVSDNAKMTDILSNVFMPNVGILVSHKFKSLLQNFKLASHEIYNAKVLYRNKYFDYFWFHFTSDLASKVDFQNSSFVVIQNYAHKIGPLQVFSINDYQEKKENLNAANPEKTISIFADRICLNSDFDEDLDLFKLGVFDTNFYISGELRASIELSKITGCNITTAHNLT